MKDWYTAGEIAALFNLNIQTLHYYESIGLFEPVRRKEGSGTRLYVFDQIYKLATIRFLKRLNYPLERIRENLDSRDLGFTLDRMRGQSEELGREIEDLARIKEAIDRKVRFIREKTERLDPLAVEKREFGARRYLPIGIEEVLYRNDAFYFYPTVVFYEKAGKRFGALLADGESPAGAQVRTIEPGAFLVGCHGGPYDRIADTFSRLREEAAARGLRVSEDTVNVNLIDQFVERDPAEFVTEVQLRIVG